MHLSDPSQSAFGGRLPLGQGGHHPARSHMQTSSFSCSGQFCLQSSGLISHRSPRVLSIHVWSFGYSFTANQLLALVQHPPSFEICGSDLKYPPNDRNYSNLTYPANDYAFSTAKRASGLSNPSVGSNFSLDGTPHSLLQESS